MVLFRCELCCSKCGALPDVLSVEVFNFEKHVVLSICPSLYIEYIIHVLGMRLCLGRTTTPLGPSTIPSIPRPPPAPMVPGMSFGRPSGAPNNGLQLESYPTTEISFTVAGLLGSHQICGSGRKRLSDHSPDWPTLDRS